jgi:uncharacterized surface protein with fasciclin (FAS1) repeats
MRTRARLAFLGPVTAALLLAACSSDSGDSSNTSGAAATEAPATSAPTATQIPSSAAASTGTIVDVAASNPDFVTLVTAVKAAGLAETLAGPGPFTVFAPTNEAFAKVPKDVLDKLLANKEALTKVLTYHVLAGEVKAADVMPGDVKSIEGSTATIADAGGQLKINDASIVATDVMASNGVIHVIDSVILPPDVDVNAL